MPINNNDIILKSSRNLFSYEIIEALNNYIYQNQSKIKDNISGRRDDVISLAKIIYQVHKIPSTEIKRNVRLIENIDKIHSDIPHSVDYNERKKQFIGLENYWGKGSYMEPETNFSTYNLQTSDVEIMIEEIIKKLSKSKTGVLGASELKNNVQRVIDKWQKSIERSKLNNNKSLFFRLPNEMWVQVFQYLNAKTDKSNVSLVCSNFNEVMENLSGNKI